MSRFTNIGSFTTSGSSAPLGIRDVNPEDQMMLFQFAANSPFEARIFATLDFDFSTNAGQNWVDVTDLALPSDDTPASWQGQQFKKPSTAGFPISAPGVYNFPVGYMPAGFFVNVQTVTSGDTVNAFCGV